MGRKSIPKDELYFKIIQSCFKGNNTLAEIEIRVNTKGLYDKLANIQGKYISKDKRQYEFLIKISNKKRDRNAIYKINYSGLFMYVCKYLLKLNTPYHKKVMESNSFLIESFKVYLDEYFNYEVSITLQDLFDGFIVGYYKFERYVYANKKTHPLFKECQDLINSLDNEKMMLGSKIGEGLSLFSMKVVSYVESKFRTLEGDTAYELFKMKIKKSN